MDAETRAAIERLRAYFEAIDLATDVHAGISASRKHYPGTEGGVQRERDIETVAKLCFSLVRADDADAISEDWLRECGFYSSKFANNTADLFSFDFGAPDSDDSLRLCVYDAGSGWVVYLDSPCEMIHLTTKDFQTKGDLRQLMRGFGQEI